MNSLSFIVPCYNEEKKIYETISSLLRIMKQFNKISFEIIIVNDASTDNTKKIILKNFLKNKNITYIENKKNLGLGGSLRKGISSAKKSKFIFIPGDNDLSKNVIVKLLRSINDADIVITYFLNDEIRGRNRLLISTLFNLIYSYTFNVFLKYINGPAIYPLNKVKKLKLRSNKFSIVAEINVKLLKLGLSFKEISSCRQNDLRDSTAVSFNSLAEAIKVYIFLIFDIYIFGKDKFNKFPIRNE